MNRLFRLPDVMTVLVLLIVAALGLVQVLLADRLFVRADQVAAQVEEFRVKQQAFRGDLDKVSATVDRFAGTTAQAAIAADSRLGDWLVREFNAEPRTLNPLTSKDVYADIVLSLYLYDSLIDVNLDTIEFYPQMAESWTVSEDKLTYTYKLRPGLVWSDGVPITADDVVFSWKAVTDPHVDAAQAAGYFKDIESVTALDRLTVQFKFSKPYFKALEVSGRMTIIPRHAYAYSDAKKFNEIRDYLVGSGRYVFDHWTPGQEIVVRRNDRYWGKPGHFDKIVFRIVLGEAAAYQMLTAQELDRMGLSSDYYQRAATDPKFKMHCDCYLYPAPSTGFSYIGWNNEHPIFKDRRVRLALTHLVPRQRMAERLFNNLVQVVSGPFWPGPPNYKGQLQYDPSVQPWPYDPARALALLAEAGWRDSDGDGLLDKDGRPFSYQFLIPSGGEVAMDIASIVKEEMGRVGIQVEIKQLEWSVFMNKLDKHEFDAVSLGWGGSRIPEDDPYQIWHSASIANQGSNFISFRNAEADRLIEAIRVEFDRHKRDELCHQFHRLLHEEQPYTFLFHGQARGAVNKRFAGVTVHALGMDDKEWWTPPGKRLYSE